MPFQTVSQSKQSEKYRHVKCINQLFGESMAYGTMPQNNQKNGQYLN